MIRRRLTLKRVDPWSVLKFGFVVNVALMLVAMLGLWILWVVIGRLGLVDQFCDSVGTIVLDLQECSLNGGNIFRTLLLLGLLGVVVQTGIMVFGAFLYNLIADLTGGLGFTFLDESGETAVTTARSAESTTRDAGREGTRDQAGARTVPAGSSATPRSAAGPGGPPDQSSRPRELTPDGPPSGASGRPDGPPPHPGGRPEGGPPPSPPSPRPGSSEPSRPTSDQRPPSRDSGSLWGDPTRSNDRT